MTKHDEAVMREAAFKRYVPDEPQGWWGLNNDRDRKIVRDAFYAGYAAADLRTKAAPEISEAMIERAVEVVICHAEFDYRTDAQNRSKAREAMRAALTAALKDNTP